MNTSELINEISGTPDCVVFPAAGLPQLKSKHVLPPDAADLYAACGGMVLFQSIAFPLTILPPAAVKLANPKIAFIDESECPDHISWNWYTIAEDGNGDFFTMDCSLERLGRCQNSFHETYAMEGQSPVVAWSLVDFIIRMRNLIQSCSTQDFHWPSRVHELNLMDAYA